MNNCGPLPLRVGTEENRSSKDPLKGTDQTPVLGSALLHSEGVEHCGGTVERYPWRPLTDRKCREEDRHEPILTPWKAIARVTGDLQNEVAVPPLVKQAALSRSLDRQPAENERA